MSLKLLSLNARGLNSPYKRRTLWKTALDMNAEVICIQETHFSNQNPPKCSHNKFPHIFTANNNNKSNGVLIAIKEDIPFTLLNKVIDEQGRFIILVAELDGGLYTLINLYAPNVRPVKFIKKILKMAKQLQKGNLILCGDFNVVLNDVLDSSSSVRRRRRTTLGPYCHTEDLYDPWRCLHTTERDYTHFSSVHKTYSRIDFFLVDKFVLQKVTKAEIHNITWSDHAPITISIEGMQKSHHTPLWRNNTYLLSRPQIREEIGKKLEEYFLLNDTTECSPTTIWCAHKAYARGILIQIAAREKRKKNKYISTLYEKIADLEAQHKSTMPQDETILTRLNGCREELRQALSNDYDIYFKRLKLSYYSQSNKASKLLAAQLRKRQHRTKLTQIRHHKTGRTERNPRAIANVFKDYYESLYNLNQDPNTHQPTSEEINAFLQHISLPKIDNESNLLLNKPISPAEVQGVIRSLPKHKSPGADGFSAEYYQAFESILTPKLVELFNKAADLGTFPKEMLQAIIVTIPKPGKDPSSPLNFRPISLLNSDLKIYAKVLANRLKEITPTLIGLDQVGFVQGRQAPDSTRRMINLLRHVELTHKPSAFIALDAEKAFDRVHWGYLSKTLTKFGINGFAHSAIMALYSDPTATVYTSGLMSDPFLLTNGTRQGCPLSPIIFSLAIEPLAEYIRMNCDIHGIKIGSIEHKLGLFADDIILTLSNPESSIQTIKTVLETFSKVSFYKINNSKCYALPINLSTPALLKLKTLFPCNWDLPSITYLGIQLTQQTSKLYSTNFPPLLTSIKGELSQIGKLHLTWLGRIAAYQMQVLPKLLYFFRTLAIPIPQSFFESLAATLRNYIWDGKKPRIALSSLYKHKLLGGCGLPNAQAYYQAALLDQVKYWFSAQENNLWSNIEQEVTPGHNLTALLIASNIRHNPNIPQYPTIKATVWAWSSFFRQKFTEEQVYTLKVPLASYEFLIQNFSTHHWKQKGIHYSTDDISSPSIMDRYMIQQIKHFTGKHTTPTLALPLTMWKHIINTGTPKYRGISLCYKYCNYNSKQLKLTPMLKWESELQKTFTLSQWLTAIKYNTKSSACVNHWDNAQKILNRWYMTPVRLHKMDTNVSPMCWRNCHCPGNLLHLLWSCVMIQPLWRDVLSLIEEIIDSNCDLTPELALLGLGVEFFPYYSRKVLIHIIYAARIAIAAQWRTTRAPTISEVISRVNSQCTMERMLAYKEGRAHIFHKHWNIWLDSTKSLGINGNE